jgi:DNA-binding response OmpR family regulator
MKFGFRRTALLVEDFPRSRHVTQSYLTEEGFDVIAARDYDAAVRTLEVCTPDVVLVDLTLPTESGYALCEHIRAKDPFFLVPILVMSERGWPEDIAHAEQVGANAYLRKPFTRERLARYLKNLLGAPQASTPSIRRLLRIEP